MTLPGKIVARWFGIALWARVLLGLVLGLMVGLLLGPDAVVVKPVGDLFIRLIKMLIVPLIFTSLVAGVTAMHDLSRLGRMGLKTLGLYLATTAVAVTGGIAWALLLRPGQGMVLEAGPGQATSASLAISDILLGMVPDNPVAALASGNVLQVIFFALLVGLGIVAVGDKAQPLKALFDAGAELMIRITHWVMELAPFGVFALIAWVTGSNGPAVLLPLAKLVATLYLACFVHMLLVSGVLVRLLAGLPLRRFFAGIRDAQLVAFSTATSSGTLPVTMACVEENLGVSRPVASFVLPLGATMNMDGTAIYMGIAALFSAQIFGVELAIGDYVAIILTGTLASIGAAGVPSAGLILIPLVLSAVGLPLDAIALIAGVDRVLDMMRTMTNVTGDTAVAVAVAASEGEIDAKIFVHRPLA